MILQNVGEPHPREFGALTATESCRFLSVSPGGASVPKTWAIASSSGYKVRVPSATAALSRAVRAATEAPAMIAALPV